jgi:DNA polymerase III delta prime subunit
MLEEFLWVEKYRPQTVEETILPVELKSVFQQFVDQGNVPNLILSGTAGVGKTTIARAMLEQLGCSYIMINGSLDRNIDVLRNQIADFASTLSLVGGRKYVILDEADYLNANSTQPALRNFMEEFSRNCGFILTCNYKNRIIPALHSRCSVVDFKISKKDMAKLAMQFMKRTENILSAEKINYDKTVMAEVIQKYFPDWRRVLNELQRYSATGAIDSGILAGMKDLSINDLIKLLKEKNFTEIRKWCANNIDNDQHTIYRSIYDNCAEFVKPDTIPCLVMILAKYQYQAAFAANPEINMVACLTEIMMECNFQ